MRAIDAKVDSWLFAGAGQFSTDPELQEALMTIAESPDSRSPLLLLAEILRTPGLFERLTEVLRPGNELRSGRQGTGHPPPASFLQN